MENDPKLFQSICLDCFHDVLSQSNASIYPDRDTTRRIIKSLAPADRGNADDANLRCCNVCLSCLQRPSGIHFAHGSVLRKMLSLLFRIYNTSESPATLNSIQTSIHEALQSVFDAYLIPPEAPNVSDIPSLARRAAANLIHNSKTIRKFLEPVLSNGDYRPTIRDVDIFVILALLSEIIQGEGMQDRTVHLAATFLVSLLGRNCRFFRTDAFRLVLTTRIHVAAMTLALDSRSPSSM
jgi:hypothetical protein